MTRNDEWNTRLTLLQKIKDRHDDHAWEDFVRYYKQYIYIIIIRMNINHQDAEEIVQIVLVKIWDKLEAFDYDPKKGNFRAWLFTVTKHTVMNYIEKKTRQIEKLKELKATEEADYLKAIKLSDMDKIAEKEWKDYISNMAWENVKPSLSDDLAEMFMMLSHGHSRQEVADKYSVPVNTVSVYKKRVIAKLKKEIKRLQHELG